ncbi:MAG: ABC1 kinase family protein [Erysipelotrichaceae bacterium]
MGQQVKRVQEITTILRKYHVIAEFKQLKHPQNIRDALEALGPTFIKIGQLLSTRVDLLDKQLISVLQTLQDHTQPLPLVELDSQFKLAYGEAWKSKFLWIDPIPIGSASLAQVHKAQTSEGVIVALKILRPNTKETVAQDLAILKRLAGLTQIPLQGRIISLKKVVQELELDFAHELDFIQETRWMEQFASNANTLAYVKVPKTIPYLCCSEIIAMEYIDGIKISAYHTLEESGYQMDEILHKLVNHMCKQIFEDGLFHADPHPGNLCIIEKKLCYFDFGSMGELTHTMQTQLLNLLLAFARSDARGVTKCLLQLTQHSKSIDTYELTMQVEHLLDVYGKQGLGDLVLQTLIFDVLQLCNHFALVLPSALVLLSKALMTLESVLTAAQPQTSLLEWISPYVKARVLEHTKAGFSLDTQLPYWLGLKTQLEAMPKQISHILDDLEHGQTTIRIAPILAKEQTRDLNKMVNRLVFALVLAAMLIASSLMVLAQQGPKVYGVAWLGVIGFILAGIFTLWLLISIIRSHHL